MSIFTPFIDSSVVSCGAMQPSLESSWMTPTAPVFFTPGSLYQGSSQLFPAQQLANMVAGQPFSIVVQPQPDLTQAVYASQLEIEAGGRAITLPSNSYIDVEALEKELGVAPKSSGSRKSKKNAKAKENKSSSPSTKDIEELEGAREALAALVEEISSTFTTKGQKTIPADELKAVAEKVSGYELVVKSYASPGSFKAAKNASEDLAAFIHIVKTKVDAFFVELDAPFPIRRVEKGEKDKKKKKWVPAAEDKTADAPAAGASTDSAPVADPPAVAPESTSAPAPAAEKDEGPKEEA